ncbi:MAG TPA: ATP synthase F1 subunit epsilon [Methylococcaceae bacterium]|nr:ATP synthase F1 subunit epsilon [Methylococcaceae bacterium]
MSRPHASGAIEVRIASLSRDIYSGACRSVVAPGVQGEMCILPRHAPLMTRLAPGEVRLAPAEGEELFFYVSGGLMETEGQTVTILADEMLRSDEIDADVAREIRRNAELMLKKSPLFSERDKAHAALIQALAQLRVIEHELAARHIKRR